MSKYGRVKNFQNIRRLPFIGFTAARSFFDVCIKLARHPFYPYLHRVFFVAKYSHLYNWYLVQSKAAKSR